MSRVKTISALLAASVLAATMALACFGAELRVGVPPAHDNPARALAAYATGYFVEERTGIAPDFREVKEDPATALTEGDIDLWLTPINEAPPEGFLTRSAGTVPGMGEAHYWLRVTTLEDLRFTTLERALGRMGKFFASDAYHTATTQPADRKTARKAVLHAD